MKATGIVMAAGAVVIALRASPLTARVRGLGTGLAVVAALVATKAAPLAVFLAALIVLLALAGWVILLLELVGELVWPLLRRTVIAGGLVRASYWLSQLARPTFAQDRAGGAALAGALALLHARTHDATGASWLEGKLTGQPKLGLAGVVASGLLAASRGDRAGARDLMLSADNFDPDFAPAAARRVANEWLVADAAERGDWTTVIRRGVLPERASAYTRFLARAAARIRGEALPGEPNPTDVGLWWSWLFAPGRKILRPLLDQARAAPRVLHQRKPPPPPAEPPPPAIDPAAYAGDPVAYAQALHALWTTAPELDKRLTPTHMQSLCTAWEAAFAPAEKRMVQRALALGAQTRGELATAGLRRVVASDLARLARAGELPLPTFDAALPIAAAAASELRATLLEEVEKGSDQLRQRTTDNRRLPSTEELREWNRLRRTYEEAVKLGGMELRYLMFPQVHRDACNYAVWLWNDRKEYGISGPIFTWLLREAEAVGDQEAIELQRKNVGVKK